MNKSRWTHLHNYRFIKEALVSLPLLEECLIDTTEVTVYHMLLYNNVVNQTCLHTTGVKRSQKTVWIN